MQNLIQILIEISIFTSIMIILVLAIKAIAGRKISSKIISILWVLVLIRALLPVTVESPIHMDSLFPKEQVEVVAEPVNSYADIDIIDEVPNAFIEIDTPTTNVPDVKTIENNYMQTQVTANMPTMKDRIEKFIDNMNFRSVAFCIWLIGVATILLINIYKMMKFNHRISRCKNLANQRLKEMLEEYKTELTLNKNIKIIESRHIGIPVVCGLFNTKILLPLGFSTKITKDKMKFILMHELCHIKRNDLLKNYIWLAVKAIHWFNPLIWIAYKAYLDDIEIFCDEMVLRKISKEDSFEYSQSLLDVIKISKSRYKAPIAVAFFENKSKLRKRVVNMLKPQKKLKSAGFVSILLALTMIIGCFTTACQPTPEELVVKSKVDDSYMDKINEDNNNVTVKPPTHTNPAQTMR